MNFSLKKASSTKALTIFQIVDDVGNIHGSITVPLGAENDLLRHWNGPTNQSARGGAPRTASKRGPVADLAQKIIDAGKRRGGKMTKAAVLRGC
jgi:hypothetical protein